jgi:Phage portal protein
VGRFTQRLKHVWNSFSADEPQLYYPAGGGPTSSSPPDRPRFRIFSERTIISSIYTRLAIDVSSIKIEHVRTDPNGQYKETIKSGLNECLTVSGNIDQSGSHIRRDMALTLFSEGVMAVLPVNTTMDPSSSGNWDIKDMRIGTVIQWKPQHVQVRAYNEKTGQKEDIWVPKSIVAIIENPFYSVMNEPNSTLQRLIHKLALLDNVDEISSKGKLDIIIQLPYVIKSEARQKQAEKRRAEVEEQLTGSTYGIAYTDGTEKITQLNRAVENNLLGQVQYLQAQLFNELGLTAEIMNGTADDVAMLNYMNRTIEPVLDAIVEGMAMKFLTKTARTQGQTIMYFQTPLKMIPISQLADIADALSRNQIATPNELRPAIGLKPSSEPQANQLVNSNMPLDQQITSGENPPAISEEEAALDKEMSDLGIEV